MTSVVQLLTSPAAAAARVLPLLADAAIKGVVIFGIAAVAVAICRRRSAATRHAIWAGAVVAQLALPALALFLPAWRVPLADRLAEQFARTPSVMAVASEDAAPAMIGVSTSPDVVVNVEAPEPAEPAQEAEPAEPPEPAEPAEPAEAVTASAPTPVAAAADMLSAREAARAAARIARAEARMARAEARMARAEARAEARAARMGHGMGMAMGRGGADLVMVHPAMALTHVSVMPHFMRGHGVAWWLRAAAVIWLLGALAIFGRFLAGTIAVSRLARQSERVDDGRWLSLTQRIAIRLGVARPMTLLRSARFDVPVTWGVVYPVVLLPDNADEWTDERRRYVLVHEMAHVKRVDAFTQLVAQLAIAVFWFDPLVWIAAHRMRVEREHACDDYVLREGTPASTYAADLLEMVRSLGVRSRATQPAFAALAMARPGELETRMHAILDPEQDRRSLTRRSTLGLAFCSLLLLLPLAAFRPFSAGASSLEMRDSSPSDMFMIGATSEVPPVPAVPAIPPIPSIPAIEAMPSTEALTGELANLTANLEANRAALAAVRANAASIASDVAPAVAWATTNTAASWNEQSCSSVSLNRKGSSTSIHSSSDDDDSSFQYISSSSGRCLQVAVWGKVEFSPDEHEVTHVSRDGRLYVRERRSDSDKELTVTSDGDELRYAYSVDGERANFEEDGRAWLSDLLPEMLRESGLNAKQRVARLRRQGGIGAVLSDISRTQSTSAKRSTYEALLQSGNLSDDDEAKIARQAGNDLSSSDGELRAVLAAMPHQGHVGPPMAEAIGAAVEHMSSDGEKRELLQQYAMQGDRDMLLVAMRRATSISSDGEKSEFLKSTVARYLGNDDEALRNTFFNVTQSISSDGEKREVLMSTLPYAQRPTVLSSVLEAGRQISSDGEKSELLIAILQRRCVTTPELKEAFMRATRTLSSDGEYRRVMEAMLQANR